MRGKYVEDVEVVVGVVDVDELVELDVVELELVLVELDVVELVDVLVDDDLNMF